MLSWFLSHVINEATIRTVSKENEQKFKEFKERKEETFFCDMKNRNKRLKTKV